MIRRAERISILSFSRSSAIGESTLSRYCNSLRIISTSIDELPIRSAFVRCSSRSLAAILLLGREDLDAGLEFGDLGIQFPRLVFCSFAMRSFRRFSIFSSRVFFIREYSAVSLENSGSLTFSRSAATRPSSSSI